MDVTSSIGRDKVLGKPRPGKEVRRTLTLRGAMLVVVIPHEYMGQGKMMYIRKTDKCWALELDEDRNRR